MFKIGFIGLGVMGEPMAANLIRKGYSVTVYNRTPGKADKLIELGADTASSPADVARNSDLIITMISNDDSIREVYYGENGLLGSMMPGSIVIDSSTISPTLARQLHRDISAKFGDFLDAPVTGSKPAAESGTLVFMVGGDIEVIHKVQDVLMTMGSKVIPMGPGGNGSIAKLAHNTIVGANVAALLEGMAIAASGDIDAKNFLELVQAGGASSKMAILKAPKLLDRDFSVQFSLGLMLKDLRLASTLSDELKTPTPILETVKSLYQMGDAMGLADLDLSSLAHNYEQWINKRITNHSSAEDTVAAASQMAEEQATTASEDSSQNRRRSERLTLNVPLKLSVYQWEQEGAFSGQLIDSTLCDISDNGLQLSTTTPLELDMFVVIHFPQDSELPPMIGRIIRIETTASRFRYGCLLAGLAPYQRLQLEAYINKQRITAD
ncbi:3-hydroxyisobutyrate dehydrogenase-like beta-hydroxyacid dehydrogenase [Paenibacillus taihuensis]|uniref:3-hydroxyisobutyrate dehydrogenase-like beta-hydroxyacid dehydrogenase n=1 Tax=Paenibacillus taihuensis TaxID=1156355 RepID=A0A3D9QU03_9BACL|nr:3-hydroxyisobutyrate dehydrogenase-like beta-hydroxyacid dehydrogenase [Paenibacillus taihuensis]